MRTQCPNCGMFYNINDENSGKKTQCERCGATFVIEEILDLEAIEEIADLKVVEEAGRQVDEIQKQPEVAARQVAETLQQIPKANKKKLGFWAWLGFIVGVLAVIGFFVDFRKKITDNSETVVAPKAAKFNATKNTEAPKIDIPRYDREFNYDIKKITLQKLNFLQDKNGLLFEKQLCTDDTYVFSWRNASGKKIYTVFSTSGGVTTSPNIEFEKITKNNNFLICETGVNTKYSVGERIYFIKNSKILLYIDNSEKEDLIGRYRRKIKGIYQPNVKSKHFFNLDIDYNFIKDSRTECIINDKGHIIYQYDKNDEYMRIYDNIAIVSREKTKTSDIFNLSTLKITKEKIGPSIMQVFRYKNMIGVISGEEYLLVNNLGNISKVDKVNFLVHEKITTDNDYERLIPFDDLDAFFIYKKNGKFGLKDFEGRILSEAVFPSEDAAKYAHATRSQNSIEAPYVLFDAKNNKWSYITKDGNTTETIDDMKWFFAPNGFSDDLASAGFFLKDNKSTLYGYFDHKFEWVIPPIFDTVTPFRSGTALVKYKGDWLLIHNPALSKKASPPSNTTAQTQITDVAELRERATKQLKEAIELRTKLRGDVTRLRKLALVSKQAGRLHDATRIEAFVKQAEEQVSQAEGLVKRAEKFAKQVEAGSASSGLASPPQNAPAITDTEYTALLEHNTDFKSAEQSLGATYKAYLATSKDEAEKKERIQGGRRWVTMREEEAAKRFKKGSPAYVQFLIDWAIHRDDTLSRIMAGNPESIKADGYFDTLDYDNIPYDGVIKPEHRLRGSGGQTTPAAVSPQAKTNLSKLDFDELQKLADQGNADAQFYLGVMYAIGRGVAQDERKAVEWFRKAAAQGHEGAKKVLERLKSQDAQGQKAKKGRTAQTQKTDVSKPIRDAQKAQKEAEEFNRRMADQMK